jgi:vesicular inhibitory amino acid transporter
MASTQPAADLEQPLLAPAAPDAAPLEPSVDHAAPGSTVAQTCCIILSIYVGLGLLSQPYGLRLGGWTALAALAGTAALFFTSASLLARACDLLPPGVPRTFPELGEALAGRAGRVAVAAAASVELFGAAIISMVVVLQQLELLLPSEGLGDLSPQVIASIITAAGLLPALALPNVSRLAPVAAAGSGASAAVALAVLSLAAIDPNRKDVHQPPAPRAIAHWPGLIQSIGIFAVSMSGHSTLPALRAAMHRPQAFPRALAAAFSIMAGAYAAVACAGYYYWGEAVSPLVTFDLASNSPYARSGGVAGRWFGVDRVLAAAVLVTCSAKLPALIMVVEELLRGCLSGEGGAQSRGVRLAGRTAIAAAALVLGVAAREELGNVLGLVGGACSMMTSLVLPLAFYARLAWGRHGQTGRSALVSLIALGLLLLVQVTLTSVLQLLHHDNP